MIFGIVSIACVGFFELAKAFEITRQYSLP